MKASDHIYHAPALEEIYVRAEKRYFDPYDIGYKIAGAISFVAWKWDRLTDWVTDDMPSGITNAASRRIRLWHSGNYSTYLMWSLVGLLLVGAYLVYGGGCECIRP